MRGRRGRSTVGTRGRSTGGAGIQDMQEYIEGAGEAEGQEYRWGRRDRRS